LAQILNSFLAMLVANSADERHVRQGGLPEVPYSSEEKRRCGLTDTGPAVPRIDRECRILRELLFSLL